MRGDGESCCRLLQRPCRFDSPVEIQIQHLAQVGAGPLERAHLADHGQHGREGAVGRLEGDMQHGARVDDLVDGLQGIARWTRSGTHPQI